MQCLQERIARIKLDGTVYNTHARARTHAQRELY